MSCISLRLPPARKVWKSFTSKLGSKLHNIRKSKTMKKQRKHQSIKPSTSIATKPPKFYATKRFRRKKFATVRSVFCSFKKKPAPVYIDKLFKEPACDVVGYLKPETSNCRPRIEIAAKVSDYERDQELKEAAEGSTSRRSYEKTSSSSDDMWESVALASPQMQGIDERAEEFITRFRRQMAAQERLARNL